MKTIAVILVIEVTVARVFSDIFSSILQAAGSTTTSGNDAVVQLVTGIVGSAPIAAVLWMQLGKREKELGEERAQHIKDVAEEKAQRQKRDDEVIALAKELGPLVVQTRDTLEAVQKGMASTVQKAATLPTRVDSDISARRQELVADKLQEITDQLAEVINASKEQR